MIGNSEAIHAWLSWLSWFPKCKNFDPTKLSSQINQTQATDEEFRYGCNSGDDHGRFPKGSFSYLTAGLRNVGTATHQGDQNVHHGQGGDGVGQIVEQNQHVVAITRSTETQGILEILRKRNGSGWYQL